MLTLYIRLFSEMVHKRYTLPLPPASSSLLAQHAHSILNESIHLAESKANEIDIQTFLLTQSKSSIASVGHALAYAAARTAGIPQPLLDLYECGAIRHDTVWYLEHAGIDRVERFKREAKAMRAAYPDLVSGRWLGELGIRAYVRAPIAGGGRGGAEEVVEGRLKEWIDGLVEYGGRGEAKL